MDTCNRRPGPNGNKNFEFIVAQKPDSIPSEAFKALRTRVQFSKIGKDALKTILITSPAPSEGKTTIAINLAGTFAQSNKKTLIIDSDLRKPRIQMFLKIPRSPGLIDYLFEKASLDEVIRSTDLENLFYIPPERFLRTLRRCLNQNRCRISWMICGKNLI